MTEFKLLLLCGLLTIPSIIALPVIVRGFNGKKGQFTYYALIEGNGLFCGGSIISKNLILTAAHCLYNYTSNFVVKTGSIYSAKGGQTYKVKKTFWARTYNPYSLMNDLGFLLVEGEILFSNDVQPIKLAKEFPVNGTELTLAGFGLQRENGNIADVIQQLKVKALDLESCAKVFYETTIVVHTGSLCTVAPLNSGACYGDSGSALVNPQGEQVGIFSFLADPCGSGYPNGFTSVPFYRNYILRVITKYSQENDS